MLPIALSAFMRDGRPDPFIFIRTFGDLITTALKATKVDHPRVAIFLLLVQTPDSRTPRQFESDDWRKIRITVIIRTE